LIWKIYSWVYKPEDRPFWVKTKDIDIYTGMREMQRGLSVGQSPEERRATLAEMQAAKKPQGVMGHLKAIVGNIL
jgi:amino acid transporter